MIDKLRMARLALVVEDETALRVIYETVLREMGFEVMEAADGEEALRILGQHSPDLVLLDILLPKVDGGQVLHYIHIMPHLQNTATLILTAHSRYQSLLTQSENDTFLLKPVRLRDIQAAIRDAVAQL
jgi:CheY-like chemotaxis protein